MLTGSDRLGRITQQGFTYLGLLFALALSGILLASLGIRTATAIQREKERELLFRADEIRRAIDAYVQFTPTGQPRWPHSLNDLVHDLRGPSPRHHLRRLYVDPFTGRADWRLLPSPMQVGGFAGVASSARIAPLLNRPAAGGSATPGLSPAACVCDWQFFASELGLSQHQRSQP